MTEETCYKESKNIVDSILRLVRLSIDKSKGIPTDDEIDFESKHLIANEMKLTKCILKGAKEE